MSQWISITLALCLGATALWSQEAPVAPAAAPAEKPADDASSEAEAAEEAEEAETQDVAAEAYLLKCAGCHTVGGGKRTGPDLLASSRWPEADLTIGIEKMVPKTGPLSAEEVSGLIVLLKDPALHTRLEEQSARIAQRFAAKLGAPDLKLGGKLFRGEEPFKKGGVSCAACHRVGGSGGNLGPDLTGIFTKLGKIGLLSACENGNFPVMRAAYADHPVTKQEALHLTHYLESIVEQEAVPVADPSLLLWGSVLALLGVVAALLWFRNPKRGVRARLLRSSYGGER